MNNTLTMRSEQRTRQINADRQHLIRAEAIMLQERLVIAARSIFEHGVAVAVGGDAAVEYGKNIRV